MLVLKPFEATVGANGGCYMKRGMAQNPRRAEDAQGREETAKLLVEQKKIYSICTLHSRRPTVQKIQSEVLSLVKQKTASRHTCNDRHYSWGHLHPPELAQRYTWIDTPCTRCTCIWEQLSQ